MNNLNSRACKVLLHSGSGFLTSEYDCYIAGWVPPATLTLLDPPPASLTSLDPLFLCLFYSVNFFQSV